ncbi:uncharacterized protein LOC100120779 [Nasonia vitripennis]|uniref:Uncharacterized protein n=1 Tax=Nasonia vitripennis TaxID=7425 RepID=A0A7M7G992_NASVI|nr:uncharacterized protein LOC100120779 [Nasonia vitripennis]
MSRFVELLAVASLLLVSSAKHFDGGVNDLHAVLDRLGSNRDGGRGKEKEAGGANDKGDEDEIESFFLLSMNHPTKLSFRYSEAPGVKVDAVVERLTSEATRKSLCTFPAFGYEPAVHHIRLVSTSEDVEILQIIKIFQEPKDNSMDIFVLNVTDCRYSKTEILRGYDYFAAGGSFTVLHPGGNSFDIFSLDGQEECGSYICKRVYNIANSSISEPRKFSFLNRHQDQTLTYMAPSINGGYFSIVRKDDNIGLFSLTPDGGLIQSIENNTESRVHFLKISTYHGYFGFCYTAEAKQKEMNCLQLDEKLSCNANVTMDLGYETSYLAVQNLPQGGFLMLTVQCANSSNCEEHEIKVRRFDTDGFNGDFASFHETGCIPRRQQQFTFFEEDDKICVFYACDCKRNEGEGYDKLVKSRCF